MFGQVRLDVWRARGVHRAPRPRTWWQRPGAAAVATTALRTAAVSVLAMLAVVLGAVLAAHGPASDAPTVLRPPAAPPAAPGTPQPQSPRPSPAPEQPGKPGTQKPGKPGAPAPSVRSIVLVPGDTLSELAARHRTTVGELQRLNGLGTSTLIYAGESFRVAGAAPAPGRTGVGDGGGGGGGSAGAARAVAYARAQLGKPYVWGGTGPRGYDCSGLVMRAWEAAGVRLPRTTWDQVRSGRATTRSALVPGDLLITAKGGHVQMYAGGGTVIHAPRTGSDITVAPLPPHSQVVAYRHISASERSGG
ncbi:NlpC/P60 family protein [Streptomyces sp. NPDC093595]|uniref:C40 family peptidase n=1 Tax=Streptomyces sp. NPDC093595 TaxID=3366045 RepID=UPI0037FBF606